MTQARLFASEDDPQIDHESSQFFTDPRDAAEFVEWCGVKAGDQVLEPSCGSGNLVTPLLERKTTVTCVELDPSWATHTAARLSQPVVCHDFLTWVPGQRFDVTVMNPPYHDALDAKFLVQASKISDRVCALLRTVFFHTEIRSEAHEWCTFKRIRYLRIRPRKFGGDHGAMTDFVWVEAIARSSRRSPGESDPVDLQFY